MDVFSYNPATMQKYHFDWKITLLFWLMRRTPPPSEAHLKQIRAHPEASPPALLYRRYPLESVENRAIPGQGGSIPIRIYRPVRDERRPVIVFFHGGGWVLGSLGSHDAICRRLAFENQVMVVAVDYRLAPEHPFPAAVEDAYDATGWVAQNAPGLGADPQRLIVMGDSAGGNLAAVVSQAARDLAGPPIAAQVLVYPVVDMVGRYPSKEQYPDTPVLTSETMAYFSRQYLPRPADARDPRVSPLLASDLSRLPPALILTAEYDPLRDEGQAYADRLRAAGVEVKHTCVPRMPHGFLSFGRLASGEDAAYAWIRQGLYECAPLLRRQRTKK